MFDRTLSPIIPGAYAVAGSAAYCGAITGSLSTAVIAFEVTGQLTHFLPIIVCTLVANLVSNYLGKNLYNSLIELKNLPYLPPIRASNRLAHRILVQEFMNKELVFVHKDLTYRHLKKILDSDKNLPLIPVVLSPYNKFLIGTIHVLELKNLLDTHLKENAFKKNKNDNQIQRKHVKEIFEQTNNESNVFFLYIFI
jgi:hypothetical protein